MVLVYNSSIGHTCPSGPVYACSVVRRSTYLGAVSSRKYASGYLGIWASGAVSSSSSRKYASGYPVNIDHIATKTLVFLVFLSVFKIFDFSTFRQSVDCSVLKIESGKFTKFFEKVRVWVSCQHRPHCNKNSSIFGVFIRVQSFRLFDFPSIRRSLRSQN